LPRHRIRSSRRAEGKKREKKRRVEESAGGLLGNEAFVLGALPTPLLLEKHITVLGQGEK
jgi:hypothetical protein